MQNDPKRLQRMKNQLELTESMAEVKRVQKVHEHSELLALKTKYNDGAPAAAKKHIELKIQQRSISVACCFQHLASFTKKKLIQKRNSKSYSRWRST